MNRVEKKIIETKWISFLLIKSKVWSIPGFAGIPIYDVVHFIVGQINTIGLRDRASSIAFNFIMAIPASAIFLFTLLPYFPASERIFNELNRLISEAMPNPESRELIVSNLNELLNIPKTGLLSIGFVVAVYYSSNAMAGIIRAFDKSLPEKRKGNFFIYRWRAIRLTMVLLLLLVGTIILTIGQGELFKKLLLSFEIRRATTIFWLGIIRFLLTISLFLFSIAFIYKYAPSVHKRWNLISPGAILATVLIMIATWLFSIWAQNFAAYNKVYGSVGALLLIMLLMFYNALMLLIGYELNVSIHYLKWQAEKRKKN